MRKIIVSMNLSLDGFMAGPRNELDWHFGFWDEEMAARAMNQLNDADTILLGRATYEAMANYWPLAPTRPGFPREDIYFAEMMNNYKKVVFSRTLKKVHWQNSVLLKENSPDTIGKMKRAGGRNIMVYGSGSIVHALTGWHLVDEFLLWVHPVVLGSGKKLFEHQEEYRKLELVKTTVLQNGVTLNCYEVCTSALVH